MTMLCRQHSIFIVDFSIGHPMPAIVLDCWRFSHSIRHFSYSRQRFSVQALTNRPTTNNMTDQPTDRPIDQPNAVMALMKFQICFHTKEFIKALIFPQSSTWLFRFGIVSSWIGHNYYHRSTVTRSPCHLSLKPSRQFASFCRSFTLLFLLNLCKFIVNYLQLSSLNWSHQQHPKFLKK